MWLFKYPILTRLTKRPQPPIICCNSPRQEMNNTKHELRSTPQFWASRNHLRGTVVVSIDTPLPTSATHKLVLIATTAVVHIHRPQAQSLNLPASRGTLPRILHSRWPSKLLHVNFKQASSPHSSRVHPRPFLSCARQDPHMSFLARYSCSLTITSPLL